MCFLPLSLLALSSRSLLLYSFCPCGRYKGRRSCRVRHSSLGATRRWLSCRAATSDFCLHPDKIMLPLLQCQLGSSTSRDCGRSGVYSLRTSTVSRENKESYACLKASSYLLQFFCAAAPQSPVFLCIVSPPCRAQTGSPEVRRSEGLCLQLALLSPSALSSHNLHLGRDHERKVAAR